jgi:hypothetical protein
MVIAPTRKRNKLRASYQKITEKQFLLLRETSGNFAWCDGFTHFRNIVLFRRGGLLGKSSHQRFPITPLAPHHDAESDRDNTEREKQNCIPTHRKTQKWGDSDECTEEHDDGIK